MIRLTIVHSNDDVKVEEYTTVHTALIAATVSENERHGLEKVSLRSMFLDVYHADEAKDFQQFGTGYHYVMIERIS